MLNLHAIEVEKILLAHGLTITKGSRDWQISNGGEKCITYGPETGTVRVKGSPVYRRHTLRGSPQTIAGILEGLVK